MVLCAFRLASLRPVSQLGRGSQRYAGTEGAGQVWHWHADQVLGSCSFACPRSYICSCSLTCSFARVTVERVFQECLTYEGEMDYKTYLDFVLAMENKKEPQALHYLFRLLDVRHDGHLDCFSLNYFFRAIQEEMRRHGQDPVPFLDVKDEIFDMVAPLDPLKITLQDLVACGKGDTVVSVCIIFLSAFSSMLPPFVLPFFAIFLPTI